MYVDDVIKPEETRPKIVKALEIMQHKKASRIDKKHGNMPV
jgi:acetyl-CoA carboxylase carboxyltransferase component